MAADPRMPAGARALAELMPKQDDPLLPAKDRKPAAGSPDDDHRGHHPADGYGGACRGRVSNELHRRLALGGGPGQTRQGEPALTAESASPAPAAPHHPPALVDAHLVWERQLAKLASIDLRLVDEPVLGAVCDQMEQLEDRILTTPARTLAGAMVQIRRVAASMAHNDGDAREQRALRLALATLARLPGA
jgi:hypothetical protein